MSEREDGRVEINGYLFPAGTSIPYTHMEMLNGRVGASPDQRRTTRRAAEIASGRHPFGRLLRQPAGQTCGTCAHCTVRAYSVAHYKCALMRAQWTKGPGTDLRKKWPACTAWEPGPSAPLDPPPPPPEPDPFAPALDVEDTSLAPALGGRI